MDLCAKEHCNSPQQSICNDSSDAVSDLKQEKKDATLVIDKKNASDISIEKNSKCDSTEAKKDLSISKVKRTISKVRLKKSKLDSNYDPTKLEDSPMQVLERFKLGCECQDDQCFKDLNPETVYRHRLNIAELTKAEHDMYLMGVTMACLTNPYQTARHTERRRLRAQYVYQGHRVCLDAFLYLENCTHYQIKRIRKHLITHGVTPRVHGNHGKVPHNTFSLDIYKIATQFLKNFIEVQEAKQKAKAVKNAPLHLSSDITRKTVHDLYTRYCKNVSPDIKIMGYSTFRRFMKVQFPHVKFAKLEFLIRNQSGHSHMGNKTENEKKESSEEGQSEPNDSMVQSTDMVPLVLANESTEQIDTYFLTPVAKLQDGISYQITTDGLVVHKSGVPLTLTNVNIVQR